MRQYSPLAHRPIALGLVTAGFVCGVFMLSSMIENTEARGRFEQDSRVLENKIPTHVPIRISFHAEKETAFKRFENEHWVNDLELEIKNTGNKPIHSLELALELADMTPAESRNTVFLMHYGRPELVQFEQPLSPSDVPIKPGESAIAKVDDNDVKAWEHFRKVGDWQLPKKVNLFFARMNFGDRTGFDGGWPPPKASLNDNIYYESQRTHS